MGMEGRRGSLATVVVGAVDIDVGSEALLAVVVCGLSPFDLQSQSSI